MSAPIRIFWLPGSSTNPALPKLKSYGWTDSFDRPNAATTLGSTDNGVAWVPSGTWGISSGAAYCAAGSGSLYAVAEANAADGAIEAQIGGVEDYGGLMFRYADDSNRLFVNWQGGGIHLYKRVAGVSTKVITVAGGAPAIGDTIRVELSGSTVVVKKNGATLTTQTITENATATKHGLLAGTAAGAGRFLKASFTPA
ncbi:hypothetical protein ACTJJ4_11495 [Microbacterium sp. 22195]|uniref:hypothetical protein n=1 Tax=Microbacterium sp. 22195 TaxID=3453891 RepID=UPI003F85E6CC